MLDSHLQRRFVQALSEVPAASTTAGRDALLIGLPANVVAALNRDNNRLVDLTNIITQLDRLGRLEKTGERPLIILAENALAHVRWTELGRTLEDISLELEHHYGGDWPSASLPPVPEILIFEGRDERLPRAFLDEAMQTGRSVARVQMPRVIAGRLRAGEFAFGTGWLIAPDLLLTNHHVVAARGPGEPEASLADCQAQVSQAVAWFDYHHEGGPHFECQCAELIDLDISLDYAVIRLAVSTHLQDRQPLIIAPQPVALRRGDRVNIVQHPRGGPLKFAIRNNFYIGVGDTPNHIRYLTDTEGGSSGSPVLNDAWQVVGLHHAYQQVPPEVYKGDVIKYHNEGIAIHAILNHLPASVRQEIEAAQGWASSDEVG